MLVKIWVRNFSRKFEITFFRSWTYHGFQLDITNRSNNIDLSMFVQSGEFDLVKVGLTKKHDRSKAQSRSIRSEKSLGTHAVPVSVHQGFSIFCDIYQIQSPTQI